MYDKNNIIAKLIHGELPIKKVYENEHAMSLHSTGRAAEVHVLIIPKGEYTDIYDFAKNASPEEQLAFWDAFAKTAEIMNTTCNFNANANTGDGPFHSGSIKHFHMHLLGGKKLKGGEGL
jgi:histidine triad (HIT) family protein